VGEPFHGAGGVAGYFVKGKFHSAQKADVGPAIEMARETMEYLNSRFLWECL